MCRCSVVIGFFSAQARTRLARRRPPMGGSARLRAEARAAVLYISEQLGIGCQFLANHAGYSEHGQTAIVELLRLHCLEIIVRLWL